MTPELLTALADVERPSNPFPGLRPFEFGESHLYFGREGQSDQLIRKLAATRFVAVVGTSGSGKSSLVRAGLLPDLFSGFMPSAGTHWRVAVMRPGNDPLGNLARALCAEGVFGSEDAENARIQAAVTEATLRRGGPGLAEAVRQNRMPPGESLLVVVDQFEELFRFARVAGSEQYRYEAAAFVKLLLEASAQREQNVYVVLTMRSDFLGDCSVFWGLPEAINEGQYLIPRMTRDQRAEAVTGPVAVGGGRITQRLVNRLLNDTGDNPDMLPILQHALMRTWGNWAADHAEDESLDLRHYEAVGTMSEALSRHAEEAWDELPDERSRLVAERVFKALTEKGEDNREVRRQTVLKDLCEQVGATVEEVAAVVEIFRREGRSFLMPPESVTLDEESLIDISHESLIRNWQRLKVWVDEESQSAQIYTRVAETALLHAQDKAGLWRDPDLQLALDWRDRTGPTAAWAGRYDPAFGEAMKFLDESVRERDAAARERERLRRREIRRTRVAAAVFFLLFVLALFAFGFAYTKTLQAQEARGRADAERANAERERDRANEQTKFALRKEAEARAAKDDALLKKKEAEEAKADALKKKGEAEEARAEALRSAEAARTNELAALAANAAAKKSEGRALAEAERSRQLLYASDMTLAQQAYEAGNVGRGADLLDAHRAAPGPRKGAADAPGFEWRYLWNLFHAEKGQGRISTGPIYLTAVSADGAVVAVRGGRGRGIGVELRDPSNGAPLRKVLDGGATIISMAVSRGGRLVAFGESRSRAVKLMDVETEKTFLLEGFPNEVTALAFSPDGKSLAAGTTQGDGPDTSGVATLWDVETRQKLRSFALPITVKALAFSPGGRTLAVADKTGLVRILDIAGGRLLCSLTVKERSPNETANSVAFSPDGRKVVAATDQGSVIIFDTGRCGGGGTPFTPLQGLPVNESKNGPASSLAYTPDGKKFAVSFADNTIGVWRGAGVGATPVATFKGHSSYIYFVSFLADGGTLVSGAEDGGMKLWDTDALVRDQRPLRHLGEVNSVAFSPDGSRLASGDADRQLYVWDAAAAEKLEVPAPTYGGPVHAVAFSPDGRLLATGAESPALALRDAATFQTLGDFPEQKGTVLSAAFSPDGSRLVTSDGGAAVRLWDTATRRLLNEAKLGEPGGQGNVVEVAFSPDGKMVAFATRRGVVKVWDAGLTRELAGHDADEEEGTPVNSLSFSPDGRTLAAAYDGGFVLLLDAAGLSVRGRLEGHKGAVHSLAYSPDGRTLATGGADGTVRLWSTASLKETVTLRAHAKAVTSLAFSRDNSTLASAGVDRVVRLWHAASAERVAASSAQPPGR
jgi:WD40 repeat protein